MGAEARCRLKRLELAIFVVLLLGAAGIAGESLWEYMRRESREPTYRRQIAYLSTVIRPCMLAQEVAEVLARRPSDDLRVNGGPLQGWLVMTPLRFGAKNWILFIDVAAGRVTQLRFRTEDSANEHPVDAPVDVGARNQC